MISRRGFLVQGTLGVPLFALSDGNFSREAKIEPGQYYLLFYDAEVLDGEDVARREFPTFMKDTVIELVPLKLHGRPIEEAIKLYKVEHA